jgi:energy-coupling factor transporter ATP-binding protein EcfA2
MADQGERKALTVLDHLVDFSGTQEPWIADALRRIVEQGGWTGADVEELCKHRKEEALDPTFSDSVYVPISRASSHASPSGDNTASLISVCHVAGVNRLPENQTVPFSPSGITVIYGNNGSGKSGYARILKSACKFRGTAPAIEGDMALPAPPKPQAKIAIQVGSREETLAWDGDSSLDDPRLRSMFVFDSTVAESYVSAEEAAHFIPFGLQIPRQLTQLMDEVKGTLGAEISAAQSENDDCFTNLKIDGETEAGKLIRSEGLAARKLEQLSTVSEEEKGQLKDLRALLEAQDAQALIATWRIYDQRLREFRETLETGSRLALAEAQKTVFDCVTTYHGAKAAADEARQALAENALLPGTGKEEWQALWKAAERFSVNGAYPGKPYPYLEGDTRCVLCQQPIREEAAARMRIFAQNVAAKHETALRAAGEGIEALIKSYQAAPSLAGALKMADTILAELLPQEKTETIRKACLTLDTAISTLKDALLRTEPAQVAALSIVDATASVDTAIVKNEARLSQATEATDPVKAAELKKKASELAARFRLGEVRPLVLEYFEHAQKIKKLGALKNRISTTEITRKEKELTAQFVTEKFIADFKKEVDRLAISTLKPQLTTKTSKAETRFKIALEENNRSISVGNIASEGEQRAVALACFLAELGQSTDRSTLIFDDPVSSLDHHNRKRIARRLVEEASIRQVIVFTHDSIFLHDILDETESRSVPCSSGRLDWKDNLPGHYFPDIPWINSTVKVRLDALEKKLGQIKRQRNPQTSQEDKDSIGIWYDFFRTTVERIVEEQLFNGCVSRFEEYIDIGSLRKCKCIDPSDIDEVQRLFGIASDFIAAHDHSAEYCADYPSCDEMREHLEATRRLVESIKTKQKAVS